MDETPQKPMDSRDFVWLAVLGLAQRNAAPFDTLGPSIDHLTGAAWIPDPELVFNCVSEMIQGGYVAPHGAGREIKTTDQGARLLCHLMSLPLPAPETPSGQVAIRLKMAFLDLLPEAQQSFPLHSIVAAYQAALASGAISFGHSETCH